MEIYTGCPRISTEYRDCSVPLAFDQHKGCSFRCLYCFAYYQRHSDHNSKDDYQKGKVRAVDAEYISKLLDGTRIKGADRVYYDYFIKQRKVIQWGALGDPFDYYEKELGTGLPIIKKLAELHYPVTFSTKATWFTSDKRYMDIFKSSPESFHFKFSIITSNPDKAGKIEQGVPSPAERFQAMEKISRIGCATTLRLRPYIIGLTDLDLRDTIYSAKEAGAESVTTEFMCLDTRASFTLKQRYKEMSKVVDYDIYSFYKRNSPATGYLRLNKEIKRPYIEELVKLTTEAGLKFYVSDPDFKELSHHGSCCGIPQRPPFDNYQHAQLTELLCYMRKEGKKEITWGEYEAMFKDDFEWQKKVPTPEPTKHTRVLSHLTCYLVNQNTWNNPASPQSPFRYLGGTLKPKGIDKDNNLIYELTG